MRPLTTAVLPFEEVYARFAAPIYRFCVSQLGDVSDAEDVAAEVFVSALGRYEHARPDGETVGVWLFRIARNAIIDRRRRQARWRRILALLSPRDHEASVESLVMTRADLREAIEQFQRLGRRDRLLLGLRVAGQLSHAEIGTLLGISEHAAAVASRRAIGRLRRRVDEQ